MIRLRPLAALAALTLLVLAPSVLAQDADDPQVVTYDYLDSEDSYSFGALLQLADGRILAVGRENVDAGQIVVVADADGNPVSPTVYATGLSDPRDLIQLADGRVLVAEAGGDRVSVVSDANGNPVPRVDYIAAISFPTDILQLTDGRVLAGTSSRVLVISDSNGAAATPTTYVDLEGSLDALIQLSDGRVLAAQTVATDNVAEYEVTVLSDTAGNAVEPTTYAFGLDGRAELLLQLDDGRVLAQNSSNSTVVVIEEGGGPSDTVLYAQVRSTFGNVQLSDGRVLVSNDDRLVLLAPFLASGLLFPSDVIQLADGRVLVVDAVDFNTGEGRVSVITDASGAPAARQDYATGLAAPTGLVQLADGRVLVTEISNFQTGEGRVSVISDASGAPVARQDYITGLAAPGRIVQLADGRVLVTEISNFQTGEGRVSVISDASGTPAARQNYATGLAAPAGIAQLADGRVVVAETLDFESGEGRVSVISDASGTPAARQDYTTDVTGPNGLAALADGRLAVVENGLDFGDDRVTLVSPDGSLATRASGFSGGSAVAVLDSGVLVFSQGVTSNGEPIGYVAELGLVGQGAVGPGNVGLVINELDSVTAPDGEDDAAEFVEIKNISDATVQLSDYALVFFSGIDDAAYASVGLTGELAPGGFITVGEPGSVYDQSPALFTGAPDDVRDEDGAVGIFRGNASDFPAGTTASQAASALVNVLIYDNGAQSSLWRDGSSLANAFGVAEDQIASGDTDGASIQRATDGGYVAAAPSPGDDTPLDTSTDDGAAAGVAVSSVFPNPATSGAALTVRLAQAQEVTAEVFDALGRRVARVQSIALPAGQDVTVTLPSEGLAPGAYVVRIAGESFAESRRFTVVR